MTTATATPQHQEQKSNYDYRNSLAMSPTLSEQATANHESNDAPQIAKILQTTLDLDDLIELFAQEAKQVVSFDYLCFRPRTSDRDIVIGSTSRHSCSYRLAIADETLGQLTYRRDKKFTNTEIIQLESLICALIYPIRNALLYQSAIDAANRDSLTGVGNRGALDNSLAREIDLAQRHKTPLSIITLDIDHFKRVNDSYGHTTGDCVIKAVAAAAVLTVRRSDMAFRYGGEEFVVILSNTNLEGASLLAERLRQEIEQTSIICNNTEISTTVSLGVASLHPDDSAKTFFERTDKALYAAKSGGRNQYRVAE